jgi:hypothetical protein
MARVTYNNLSEKFKKQIGWGKPLERDEVVEFQWLDIPLVKQNGEFLPFYSLKRLPNVDSVYDPYREEKDGGPGMVQIAYVENELKNTEDKPTAGLGEIEFTKANKCTITISGRDSSKMNLLYYLRAHSLNQSNPLATPSNYGFKFKELEPVKTAKQKMKEYKDLNDTMNYIMEMKEAEVVSILGALKHAIKPSFEENQASLVSFIQDKPNREKFQALSKDVRTPIAALITKAVELELIRYQKDPKTWIYVATGKELTQVPPQTDNIEHLLGYFHNNKNGKAFKDFLEKEVELIRAEKAKIGAEKDVVGIVADDKNDKKDGDKK